MQKCIKGPSIKDVGNLEGVRSQKFIKICRLIYLRHGGGSVKISEKGTDVFMDGL